MQEEGDGIPVGMPFLPWWIDHPVCSRPQLVVGQSLQHIANVHHDLSLTGNGVYPISLFIHDLEAVC